MFQSPFFYSIKMQVAPGNIYAFHEATKSVVHAHRNHKDGLKYAMYQTYAGIGGQFEVLVPFSKLADLDSMSENHTLFEEVYGVEDGKQKLAQWGESITSFDTVIYRSLDEHSNYGCLTDSVPDTLYHLRVFSTPGKLYDLHDTTEKLIAAHKSSPNGSKIAAYAVYAGNGTQYDFYLPSEGGLSGLDSLVENDSLLVDCYGVSEGQDLLQSWGAAIASFDQEILQLDAENSTICDAISS